MKVDIKKIVKDFRRMGIDIEVLGEGSSEIVCECMQVGEVDDYFAEKGINYQWTVDFLIIDKD